jgi:hypothetical protein
MSVIGARRNSDRFAAPRAFARGVARLAPEVDVRILPPGERVSLCASNETD